jgi:hypothetical protein
MKKINSYLSIKSSDFPFEPKPLNDSMLKKIRKSMDSSPYIDRQFSSLIRLCAEFEIVAFNWERIVLSKESSVNHQI